MWPSNDGSGGHGGHSHPPPDLQPYANGYAPPLTMYNMVPSRPPPLVPGQRSDVRAAGGYRAAPAAMQPPYWHDPRMAPQPMVQPSPPFSAPPPYVWDPQMQQPQWQQQPPPQWNSLQQSMPMMTQPPPQPRPHIAAAAPQQYWQQHELKPQEHPYVDNGVQQPQQQQPVFPRNWSEASVPKHPSGGGSGFATMWENPKSSANGGAADWNPARANGNWALHDERPQQQHQQHARYEATSASVGSWNPNDVQDTQSAAVAPDMVWRDPNPKLKKQQRDMGTAIWGDPTQQNGAINNWTRPDNAPPDFNWERTVTSAVVSNPNHGYGWNDPIPSDRTPRDAQLEMNIGASGEASLQAVLSQLESAVRKGLLSASVLHRPPSQTSASLLDLNELLRYIARVEQLQLEKDRLLASQMTGGHKASMLSNIDVQIHQAKLELEKARANVMKEETFSGDRSSVERNSTSSERNGTSGSKLQQWKRGQLQLQQLQQQQQQAQPSLNHDPSIDHITVSAKKMTLEERRGVSDWLEASPGPGEPTTKEDGTPLEGLEEFVPGKAWNWMDPNKIAQDPNITPGQLKSSPLVSLKGVNGVVDSVSSECLVEEGATTPFQEPWTHLDQDGVRTDTTTDMWLMIPHLMQPSRIYQLSQKIGTIGSFSVHENHAYVRWSSNVNMPEARAMIAQIMPQGTNIRILRNDQVQEAMQNEK